MIMIDERHGDASIMRDGVVGTMPMHLKGLSLRLKMLMTLVRIDLKNNKFKSKVVTLCYLLSFPVPNVRLNYCL